MLFYKMTNKGRVRKNNEDYFYAEIFKNHKLKNLFIVCDGVGGNNYGEVASKLAVKAFSNYVTNEIDLVKVDGPSIKSLFQFGISFAEKAIKTLSIRKPKTKGMCTTFLCSTIYNDKLYISNIGDSRLYLLTKIESKDDNGNTIINTTIDQVTIDNTEIIEEKIIPSDIQKDLEKNQNIDLSSIANVVTKKKKYLAKALGFTNNVLGDFYEIDLSSKIKEGKEIYVLMCSDGLYNMLSNEQISNIILSNYDIKKKTKQLIKMALNAGGKDNISAILIKV